MSRANRRHLATSAVAGAITENLIVRLAAYEIQGLADDGPIVTWEDLSVANNDATNLTGVNRVLYKVGVKNNLPVARGAGGRYLSFATLNEAADSFTSYIVMNPTDVAGTDGKILQDSSSGNFKLYSSDDASGPRSLGYNDSAGDHPIVAATTGWQIVSWHLNKATQVGEVFRNGVSQGTATYPAAGTTIGTPFFMNSAAGSGVGPFIGDVGEFLFYRGTHTLAQRVATEAYLNGVWAVY